MDLTPFAEPPEVPGFRLSALLGFGAHGEVWRAEDLVLGDEVALKIGRRRDPVEFGSEQSFSGPEYETSLLSRIEHPHIVRMQRVVVLPDDHLALVLDLAAGGSLAALVAARGPLPPEEVVTVLIPMVSALEHLHQSGLTHGDVSPGNILLAADGCPRLGDLGVARMLGERHEDVWGTPGFIDPAVVHTLAGDGPVDAAALRAADVWALAASCWFALTGHPPVHPLAVDSVDSADSADPPDDLFRVLARGLAADPQQRPGLSELADLAWRAARPSPIRLKSGAGAPPVRELTTRRVPPPRQSARPSVKEPSPEVSPVRRTVPVTRLLALLAAIGLLGAVTAGVGRHMLRTTGAGPVAASGSRSEDVAAARSVQVTEGEAGPGEAGLGEVRPGGAGSGEVGSGVAGLGEAGPGRAGSGETGSGVAERGENGPGEIRPGEQLDVELTEALTRIGRARAQAFEMVSQQKLALADDPGSPAERADQGLLKRLRRNGYRLEALDYRFGRVEVLKVRGSTAQVRAVVSTTAHRQVRVSGGFAAGVPPAEAAPLVFTLRAVGPVQEGAGRWRVHDIRNGE
ncbi:serine/threonine-protein kinase [Kineosporia sp. NBRC 101731]|uniref:serine/threonine-protein kinase n=1 Tax=Kineosporia sp. NBRC 101731 TaxID=3032199 RepID=UPI0024A53D85|nr:serine/threonine-protein kinase [Kineosporia sp. NBRC 101731]GLY32805.1 hypothetical protein Kisp02_61700 [Kineosporia sp. NBRC 101731]